MNDFRKAYNKSILDHACEVGWNEAAGAEEHDYYPTDANHSWGRIRIPYSGLWMYVRCPKAEIVYERGFYPGLRLTGEYSYWRHRRFMPEWNDSLTIEIELDGETRNGLSVGSRGYIVGE